MSIARTLPPILPVGTRVVSLGEVRRKDGSVSAPRGSIGVVVEMPGDPWHSYRVEFAGGASVVMKRDDFTVLRKFTDGPAADVMAEHNLWPHVILKVVVGSQAQGLTTQSSDIDRRGVYLPPASQHWSLYGVPEQLDNTQTEESYWELQKFLTLALKANPNVLEVLWSPMVEHATPIARELRAMRRAFNSRLVYQTFGGYVLSQFKKLQAGLRNHGEAKPKHVMHLIRLLIAGTQLLETGELPVDAGEHRDRLMAIKRGETGFDEADAWRQQLHAKFDATAAKTTLPDRPDYAAANDFLIRARRTALEDEEAAS